MIPESWLEEQAEKKRLAEEKAKLEGEDSGSRPNSKQKGKKPKKKAKGKKGKKDEEEEEKEEVYPIINLDYSCIRSNSLPTLTAFNDFYKVLREKVSKRCLRDVYWFLEFEDFDYWWWQCRHDFRWRERLIISNLHDFSINFHIAYQLPP